MKTMKLALLGGAALAVSAVGAQADELTALKAQLETLNNRVAQLETAPQVPAGYNLMTISEGKATVVPGNELTASERRAYGDTATFISILPSADAAPAASIEWSGYVRTILGYNDDADDVSVYARGQLQVVGKTETAVGEVGVRIGLRAEDFLHDVKSPFKSNEAYGWWSFAPGMTLGGGYTGSLGNIGYGVDGACTCWFTDNGDGADLNPGDAEQMRLTYSSGPITWAVAVENSDIASGTGVDGDVAFASELKWAGDTLGFELSGFYDPNGPNDIYQVGVGTSIALGDMAALSLGAVVGRDNKLAARNDYWAVSGLASIDLSDEVYAELGYAYKDRDVGKGSHDAIVGLYYAPVDQLTLGLEGEWLNDAGPGGDNWLAGFVSVFRF